jgi:TonB family protein
LIHFDFEDRYQDEHVVGSAITRREGVILSVAVHVILLVALVVVPKLPIFQPSPEELERREALLRRIRPDENRTFVFVQPRVDLQAQRPPERAELSDIDRVARARERAAAPTNPLPFARGNSSERVEAAEPAPRPEPPEPPAPEPASPQPETQTARALPPAETGPRRETPPQSRVQAGVLAEALKNLQRYVQNESFENPQGGATEPGASIQFDTKGIEFGPWLRRFVAQVRRNWFIPLAAFSMHGRVVLQFNIWKDGHISDLAIVGPSDIGAFNNAAFNAIRTSNPTEPLPPEYPTEKAFFTVTFYYNEPPGQ